MKAYSFHDYLVERTDARGDRGNNGDSEGNDKIKKSYLVVVMYL